MPNNQFPPKPTSFLLIPKFLSLSNSNFPFPLSSASLTSTIFSNLASSDAAFAAQQLTDKAEGDIAAGLALLLALIPTIAWVLLNILQPTLNQINWMRNDKGVIIGLGLADPFGFCGELSYPPTVATVVTASARLNSMLHQPHLVLSDRKYDFGALAMLEDSERH